MMKLSYQKVKLVQQLVTVENTFLLGSHYFNTLALQLYFNLTSILFPRYLIVGLKHLNNERLQARLAILKYVHAYVFI